MANIQKSLVLIKPDAVERNLVGTIISAYEEAGLKVVDLKMLNVPKELANKHYEEHKEKVFFMELIEYITRSPVVAMVLEGENAIAKVREVNGKTNPEEAIEGTIRKRFALSKAENSVHASDSEESALREIGLWFEGK